MFSRKYLIIGLIIGVILLASVSCVSAINKDDYSPLDYKQMDKNSDKFLTKKLSATGTVFQIMEDSTGGLILLSVDGDSSQNIAVMYKGTNDVVEDDTITVYGIGATDYTYESQAGLKITVPCILADEIEK